MIRESLFDAGGIQINFAQASDSGKPVVLLHGTASEWQSFQPLIPVLAQNHKILAMDLRGHGKSGRAPGEYRLLDYARDVQYFLEAQNKEPAIVYGHSLGAQIAIAVAARSPDSVRAVILGDIPYYFHNLKMKDSVWYEPFIELHQVASMHSAQEMDDYMAVHYPKMDPQRRKARAETLSHVDPEAIAAIINESCLDGYDPDELPRQITCPVLVIQGNPAKGSALRDEDLQYLVERLHCSTIVKMEDVGHGLPVGDSLSRVVDFLRTLEG